MVGELFTGQYLGQRFSSWELGGQAALLGHM